MSSSINAYGDEEKSETMQRVKHIYINNIKINLVDKEMVFDFINNCIKKKMSAQIITLNTVMFVKAFYNKKLREVINNSELVIPESIGIIWALKRYGIEIRNYLTGADLVRGLIDRPGNSFTMFLLGGKPAVISKMDHLIKRKRSNLKITGYYHGYFSKAKEKDIVHAIKKVCPDILLVGLGSPKQELWIYNNRENLNHKVAIGVGGSFDAYTTYRKRAPLFIRKIGLEWIYRIIQRPYRIFIIKYLVIFLFLVQFMHKKINKKVF